MITIRPKHTVISGGDANIAKSIQPNVCKMDWGCFASVYGSNAMCNRVMVQTTRYTYANKAHHISMVQHQISLNFNAKHIIIETRKPTFISRIIIWTEFNASLRQCFQYSCVTCCVRPRLPFSTSPFLNSWIYYTLNAKAARTIREWIFVAIRSALNSLWFCDTVWDAKSYHNRKLLRHSFESM